MVYNYPIFYLVLCLFARKDIRSTMTAENLTLKLNLEVDKGRQNITYTLMAKYVYLYSGCINQ